MRWLISCCMQQAWKPQLPRARRYLSHVLDSDDASEVGRYHTIDEGVQDGHGTVGDTGIWVNLLEYWVRRVSIIRIT